MSSLDLDNLAEMPAPVSLEDEGECLLAIGAAGDENPSARATFGIYDGGDQQIYRRELY